jgi:hypothetical protein
VPPGMLYGFWNLIFGEAHQQRNCIRNPIIQVFHSWMSKRILGRMRETKVTDTELNWLSFPNDQPMVLRGNIGGGRYWFGVLPLYVGHLPTAGDHKKPRTSFVWDLSRH